MDKNIEMLRDLDLEIESLKARKQAIKDKALQHRDTVTDSEVDSATAEVVAINKEIEEKEAQKRSIQIENEKMKKEHLPTMEDRKTTMEYRQAFMDYVQKGIQNDILEKRVDAATSTTTAATVIPTTIVAEIQRLNKISGNILSKVRKLNIKGGVQFPVLSATPTASWINETTSSSRQSLTTDKVVFSYFGLECKIAQTLLSEYTSIEEFEAQFAVLALEAMTNAKEIAVFNGTGTTQLTGIFKTSGITSVDMTEADLTSYKKLVDAISLLPVGYRANAEFYMAAETWGKIVGMVDTVGQPVARVNYGLNGETMTLFGKPVNLVEEDRIKGFTTATAGTDYVICYGDLSKYAINGNGDLGVYRYRDEDKNQDVTKALEFLDGKVLQAKAFVCIKKKAGA